MIMEILNTENGHTEPHVNLGAYLFRDGYGQRAPQTPQEGLAIFFGAWNTGKADPDSLKRYVGMVEPIGETVWKIGPYIGTLVTA